MKAFLCPDYGKIGISVNGRATQLANERVRDDDNHIQIVEKS